MEELKDKYPLYPKLSEEAKEDAQKLINEFKVKLTEIASDTITALYTDVAIYIETDSWGNFRNELLDGLRNYSNSKIQGQYDFQKIRQSILENHKAEIVADLNQDLLKEIEQLKEQIDYLQRTRS